MENNKKYYFDYPSKPIGGGNPYYECSFCEISDPQINGQLKTHSKDCEYRIAMEALESEDFEKIKNVLETLIVRAAYNKRNSEW